MNALIAIGIGSLAYFGIVRNQNKLAIAWFSEKTKRRNRLACDHMDDLLRDHKKQLRVDCGLEKPELDKLIEKIKIREEHGWNHDDFKV